MSICSQKWTKKAITIDFVSCRERSLSANNYAMKKWEETAEAAWAAILLRVERLKTEGKTLQEIADIVGANSRSVIGEWLNKNRKAVNAPFADLMSYLERLHIDYIDFFPDRAMRDSRQVASKSNSSSPSGLEEVYKENERLQLENQKLTLELEKANAVAAAFQKIVQQHMAAASGQASDASQDKTFEKSA